MPVAKANGATRTSIGYRAVSAAVAFSIWGAWAFFINGKAGDTGRLISAAAQGSASFIITLIMVSAVTRIFNLLPISRARAVLPSIITVVCTGSCLTLMHFIVGTEEIARTISPALTVATLFCLHTTAKLEKAEKETRCDG